MVTARSAHSLRFSLRAAPLFTAASPLATPLTPADLSDPTGGAAVLPSAAPCAGSGTQTLAAAPSAATDSAAGASPPAPSEAPLSATAMPPIRLSLCGGEASPWPPALASESQRERFEAHIVSHEQLVSEPLLLYHPDLRVCVGGCHLSYASAAPLLVAHLAFGESLAADSLYSSSLLRSAALSPAPVGDAPERHAAPQYVTRHRRTGSKGARAGVWGKGKELDGAEPVESRRRSWFSWGRSGGGGSVPPPSRAGGELADDLEAGRGPGGESGAASAAAPAARAGDSNRSLSLDSGASSIAINIEDIDETDLPTLTSAAARSAGSTAASAGGRSTPSGRLTPNLTNTDNESQEGFFSSDLDGSASGRRRRPLRKTTSPSSEQLRALQLKEGSNTICFRVNSEWQGTQLLTANIYLFSPLAKLVISDVDGTITKSDVLGQMLPRVGVDWSHLGVTALHQCIAVNGYQMVYLTARGIGMATTTKEYLASIKQGEDMLPPAPVLLSPTRLIESLTREVIRRNPEEFKIECLQQVRSLWPEERNPFYAGFGNNSHDETAYLAAGVPPARIFVINPQGEIRRGGGTYCWASYPRLLELAQEVFPPLEELAAVADADGGATALSDVAEPVEDEFKSFNFWRIPPPLLEADEAPAEKEPP